MELRASEASVIEQEKMAFEESYSRNWHPKRLYKDAFYRKYAQPLKEGGNNHRYPGYNEQLNALLGLKGKRILDCACGAGDLAIWLALNGFEVWAFDFSQNAIDVAAKSAAMSGVGKQVHFAAMDARSLQYEDRFFDAITGKDCLHHLIKYPAAIRELARVLKPGGRGLFFEPLAWNPGINLMRLVNIWFRGYVGEHMLTNGDVAMLQEVFGQLYMKHNVVFSAATRLIADTHRPITALARRACEALISLDESVLGKAPSLKQYSAAAYLELVKLHG